MTKRVYYTCHRDEEYFRHTTPEPAIDEALYYYDKDEMPETLTLYKFVPQTIGEYDITWAATVALKDLLERFDEENGDPDEATKPTPTMEAAALAFVRAVVAEYHVWSCGPDPVQPEQVINVAEYLANRVA